MESAVKILLCLEAGCAVDQSFPVLPDFKKTGPAGHAGRGLSNPLTSTY